MKITSYVTPEGGHEEVKPIFEATKQSGLPGHCYQAQVFKNGKSYIAIEPTEDPFEATEIAFRIASFLNGLAFNAELLERAEKAESELKSLKIELSNYAYQMDLAKRDRDKAENNYHAFKDMHHEKNERVCQLESELALSKEILSEMHNKIMVQWEKDFGSIHSEQKMDAYTVSGFIKSITKT